MQTSSSPPAFARSASSWSKRRPGGSPAARRSALDFGCGIGRLSQALAEHFDQVYGVDISPKMIELARAAQSQGRALSSMCATRPAT